MSRPQTVEEAQRRTRDVRQLKNRLEHAKEKREIELNPEKRRTLDTEITALELDLAGEDNIQEDFAAWLVGKGKTEDHARTPWERTPLNHNPGVVEYLQQFHDARWKFIFQLNEVQFAVRKGNANIGQLFNYYRFFIRGKLDPDDINSIDFLKFYRELGPGNAPYYEDDFIEPESVAMIDSWWLHWDRVPLGEAEKYARDRASIKSELIQTERLLKSVDRGLVDYSSVDDVRRDERELREKLEETAESYFANIAEKVEHLPPELQVRVKADAARQFVGIQQVKIAAVKEFADMRVEQSDILRQLTRLETMKQKMQPQGDMNQAEIMAQKALHNQKVLLQAQKGVLENKLRRLKEKWEGEVPELSEFQLDFQHPLDDDERKKFSRMVDQIDAAVEFAEHPLKFDKMPEALLQKEEEAHLKGVRKNIASLKTLVDAVPSNDNKIKLLSAQLGLAKLENELLFTEDPKEEAKIGELQRRIQSLDPIRLSRTGFDASLEDMHDDILKDTVKSFYNDLLDNPSELNTFFDDVRPYLIETAVRAFNKAGDFPSGGETVQRGVIGDMLSKIDRAVNWGDVVANVRDFESKMQTFADSFAENAQGELRLATGAESKFEKDEHLQRYQGFLKERDRIKKLSSSVQVHVSNMKSKMVAAARERIRQLKREATDVFNDGSRTVKNRILTIVDHKKEAINIWQVMKTERDLTMSEAPEAAEEPIATSPDSPEKEAARKQLGQQMRELPEVIGFGGTRKGEESS